MSTRSRAFVPWLAGVALATLAVGCDGCTKAGQLRVDGDFPYVRCLAVDEREAAEWSVGDLRLRSEGRVLTIEGIEPPLRMAAFVGPGPGSADPTRALGALGPHGAKLVWVLGELGDSEAHAQRTLAALAAYPGVSLVLASGRDDFDVLEEAWDSLSDEAAAHVIDLRPFRAVRVGTSVFGLTSGGAGGRYARNRSSSGFGEDDLEEVEDALPDAEEARRFFAEHPFECFERCLAVGPGLAVAHRDLRRVGKAGLHGGVGLTVHHGDFMAALQQMPRGAHADDAGA